MKSIYERVLNLRDRISLDGDDTIYEEDYLLLDEVLDLIENIGGEDTDIETQIYDYNNTVDIYKELEVGATVKRYFELKAKGITTEAEALEHRELLNKINEMVGIK